MGNAWHLFLYFRLFNTFFCNVRYKNVLTSTTDSSVGSKNSANWATTTAQKTFFLEISFTTYHFYVLTLWNWSPFEINITTSGLRMAKVCIEEGEREKYAWRDAAVRSWWLSWLKVESSKPAPTREKLAIVLKRTRFKGE